tara:strand:- start:106 stop:225 length:120 start_codon:yes stop_codon:yes gene_type:complete
MKEYIQKIKEELAMKGYLNGWLIKYYKNKLKELEDKDER